MTDHEKMGLVALLLVVLSLLFAVFAIVKMVMAFFPALAIGAVVGGLLYWKSKS